MSEADSQISRKSKMPEAMLYKYVRTYVCSTFPINMHAQMYILGL